jgi:hypothetical protein
VGTPGLVPIVGPNGTFMVPEQVGGAFGVQGAPPIAAPPPTFDPSELQPPPVDLPPQPDPAALAPQPAAPPPGPPTLDDVSAGLDQQLAAQRTQPAPDPRDPTGMAIGALDQRQRAGEAAAAVEGAQGRDEKAVYDDLLRKEEAATKARDDEREQHRKEVASNRASLESAQKAFEDHKVDQGRMWKDMGTGRQIAAAIGIALSGIGGALVARDTGRPVTNPALDMMTAAIDRDVRLQLADRDKLGATVGMKRDAISDLRAKYTDDEAAFGAVKAAYLHRSELQLKGIAAAAKDPKAKANALDFAASIGAEKAKVFGDAIAREEQAKQQAIENKRAQSQLGLGWANYKAGEKRDERDFAEDKARWEAEFETNYAFRMKEAERLALAGNAAAANAARNEAKEERAAKKADLDQKLEIGARKVYDPEGNPLLDDEGIDGLFLAGDSKRGGELQKMISNTHTMTQLTDDMIRLRDKHGWSADMVRSPEWQQMKSTFANMQLTEKDVRTLGALTGSDIDILSSVLGTDDPTGVRDPTPGFRQFRKNAVRGLNNELRAKGYKGKPIVLPELTKLGVQNDAANTPVGRLVETAQERSKDPYRLIGADTKDLTPSVGDVLARTPGLSQFAGPNASRTSGFQGAPVPSDGAERAIWGLVAVAGSGNEQAKRALQVMSEDKNPRIRELVRQVAEQNPSLGITIKAAK